MDIIRKYVFDQHSRRAMAPQVKSVLSKIMVCRTPILDGHLYKCPSCDHRINVYNSCGDRHCPQCAGARRADWLDKASKLILPGVHYFQVIFTLPDKLSPLILGNRRQLYSLLFRSVWQSLSTLLREAGQFQPAALMVLHTWNQRLDHHPHIHAIVPGGGPSLNGQRWVSSRHPKQPRRKKPYLVDNIELGRLFRKIFIRRLKRLIQTGKLKLDVQWSMLPKSKQLKQWLGELQQTDWNVFIQGPPKASSDPQDALKYLTRYMTGGPISDRRMVSDKNGRVTWLARSKDKRAGNPQVPVEVSGHEFVRRWAMHILPKGFTKSRYYGGYHPSKRKDYLQDCRRLLPPVKSLQSQTSEQESIGQQEEYAPNCPRCESPMLCVAFRPRPSWKDVFQRRSYSTHSTVLPVHGSGRYYVPDD